MDVQFEWILQCFCSSWPCSHSCGWSGISCKKKKKKQYIYIYQNLCHNRSLTLDQRVNLLSCSCSSSWGILYCDAQATGVSSLHQLQEIHNAADTLFRTPERAHVTPALILFHWLHFRIFFNILKSLREFYMDMINLLQAHIPSRSLMSSDQGLLAVLQSQLKD